MPFRLAPFINMVEFRSHAALGAASGRGATTRMASSKTPKKRRGDRLRPNETTPGELLPQIMRELGLEARMWEENLLREWTSLAGPQLSRHTRPGRLERGTLYVFVAHSTWLSELQRYGQKQLLANLQERFGPGKIKRLRLQLDPDLNRRPSR